MIDMVPSAVSLRSTKISLVCCLDSSTLHSKGTTVPQELAGHDGGARTLVACWTLSYVHMLLSYEMTTGTTCYLFWDNL